MSKPKSRLMNGLERCRARSYELHDQNFQQQKRPKLERTLFSRRDSLHLHPLRRARPFALTTCAPSVPHGSVGSMGASGACSACTSLIFVRCASPPGTARATLRALLRPARAPRGSTCGPRGAGGPSGPWRSTRTCSAPASSLGAGWLAVYTPFVQEFRKLQVVWVLSLYEYILT